MKEHNHGATSNTDEVYRTFIGCTVKGLVRQITYNGEHADILIFSCGWGLAFNSNGSHWIIRPDEMRRHISCALEELEASNRELEHILSLAGE